MAYSTITKPTDYFTPNLHTGTGSATSITGLDFQPDLVWVKQRDGTNGNGLYDVIRGATQYIGTDYTGAEATVAGTVTAFNSDGFSVGTHASVNGSSNTYVSWNWLAGGTASSNTDGSITSSVSANTTAGFSIVSFTGTGSAGTIGHGLGAIPVMGIFKNRTDSATNWRVWHQGITNTQILELSATSAAAVPGTADFNISNNTTDVWGLETNNQSNGSGDSMIAYIFAEKKGFSKFGSYTGNGSADGSFIYTGFKPAWVMIKRSDTGGVGYNWFMLDNKRGTYNPVNPFLKANASDAESTASWSKYDFLSNGFKLRDSDISINASGGTYIYMAFAENPLVSNTGGGIPATAR